MTEAPALKTSRLAALRSALEQGSMRHGQRMINSMHPAEIASLIESLPPAKREIVWEFVDPEIEGDVLIELNEEVRSELIGGMDAEELIAATEGMEVDDLADLIGDLPETLNQRVLRSMDAQDRERLNAVLAFEEDSAGGLMNLDTVTVRPDVTLNYVKEQCAAGARLELYTYAGAGHFAVRTVAAPEVLAWLLARVGGTPAAPGCTTQAK